ncbi:MAG: hemolysin family protein [Arenimonas sp.]|jgi:putative hemolysin
MYALLLVILLIVCNGFFSMSEMAVMTSRKGRLKEMARDSRGARKALELAEHPEGFLSAVQVWITLLSLVTGYVGGQSLGNRLVEPISHFLPIVAKYAVFISTSIGFLLMVFLSVVIGELVPKRLGTLRPELVASRVALPMHFFATVARPAVLLLAASTRFFLRLMGLASLSAEKVTEEEIRHLVTESHEQGVIDEDERNMLNRVLRLGERSADSLMTPRTRIIWLDAEASIEENLATMRETPFSRYPVYRGSDTDVIGILEVKSLAGRISADNNDLFRDMRPALFVSDSTNALKLLEIFREEQQPIALVVDEYGDIQGMVALNDLLGAVLGRAQATESSDDEPLVVEREDGSWLVDGRLSSEDLREILGLHELPGEDENDFTTAAGMVIARYGRIPHAGEHFDWRGWRIEVVDLDGARIDKLLIARALSGSTGEA